jgi:hypothetical protein
MSARLLLPPVGRSWLLPLTIDTVEKVENRTTPKISRASTILRQRRLSRDVSSLHPIRSRKSSRVAEIDAMQHVDQT